MRWVVLVVIAACGRIDFDATLVAPSDAPPDQSLVARCPMELLANATTPDVTGHGHDLACEACPALVAGRAATDHAVACVRRIEGARPGTAEDYLFTNATVEDAVWHHAAIVWDGTAKTVWLDGVMVMAQAAPMEFDDGIVNVGADLDNGGTVAAFPGSIDEVRIYNRALTATEIHELAI